MVRTPRAAGRVITRHVILNLVTCWISPSVCVACALAAFGGSISPWRGQLPHALVVWYICWTSDGASRTVLSSLDCCRSGRIAVGGHHIHKSVISPDTCHEVTFLTHDTLPSASLLQVRVHFYICAVFCLVVFVYIAC